MSYFRVKHYTIIPGPQDAQITMVCQSGLMIGFAIISTKNGLRKGFYSLMIFFINKTFMTLKYLCYKIGVKCNFLEYETIKEKILRLHISF